MKKPVSVLWFTSILLLPGPTSADDENTVIAVVNGTEITLDRESALPGINSDEDFFSLTIEKKSQVIMSLINRQLVLEQAQKEGFHQSQDIKDALQDLTDTYVVEQYLLRVAAAFDLSDDAMMRYYRDHFSESREQYKVSHILLKSEEEAKTLLGQLAGAADFSSLAGSESMDRNTADNGGNLGWLSRDEMVPSFFQAVSALSDGKISDQPVRTQFGWHIVRLDARRNLDPTPFSAVKLQIQQQMIQEQMAAYFDGLRERATIEIR